MEMETYGSASAEWLKEICFHFSISSWYSEYMCAVMFLSSIHSFVLLGQNEMCAVQRKYCFPSILWQFSDHSGATYNKTSILRGVQVFSLLPNSHYS